MWRALYHELLRWAKFTGHARPTFRGTEVTLEVNRVWIIRMTRTQRGWCTECGREVDLVRPQAAIVIGKMMQEQPYDCERDSGWHWAKSGDGSSLVCLPSVMKSRKGRGVQKKFTKEEGVS